MMPNSSQISLLRAMGIPVWKLRGRAEEKSVVGGCNPPDTTALLGRISNSNFLVCHDSHITKQTNYLFQAMMSTIGLSGAAPCLISLAELDILTTLKETETKQKVLLLMGDDAVKQFFGDEENVVTYRNNTHNIEKSKLTVIVSFGLNDLMLNPKNKAYALQDLHRVKFTYNNMREKNEI